MTSAAKLIGTTPVRAMIVGYPGGGKTGALACLADAGFKLRVRDYDHNYEPLLRYTRPDALANIDIVSLEDRLRMGAKYVEPSGIPEAFARGLKLMDYWKYTDDDGEEIDLGRSKDWGPDTVVVLDSLTSMGKASYRRTMVMNNRNPGNMRIQDQGAAQNEQEAFIERLTSPRNRHHVVVLAHLRMIGPKPSDLKDDSLTKELKERAAEIVATRLYPSALGQVLPPLIGGHFPTLLLAEAEFKGNKVKRVLRTLPRPELDLKLSTPDLPGTLPLEDGMLQVFETLFGVSNCLGSKGDKPPTSPPNGGGAPSIVKENDDGTG